MYCITRNDMKFGQYFIPARTKATIIGQPSSHSVNVPGVQLRLAVNLFDAHPKRKTGVPMPEVQINDEVEGKGYYPPDSYMTGITIWSHADRVYMDAGDEFYQYATLGKWELRKIFGEAIPEEVVKENFCGGYRLDTTIEYLENEFADWVHENCDFYELTEEDIENGLGFDGAESGNTTLSPRGMQKFEDKQLEYKKRLEVIGFTYEFKGGLIWE